MFNLSILASLIAQRLCTFRTVSVFSYIPLRLIWAIFLLVCTTKINLSATLHSDNVQDIAVSSGL